jgi:hypothetical protein
VWSMPIDYKSDREYRLSQSKLETPACQDMNLREEDINEGVS